MSHAKDNKDEAPRPGYRFLLFFLLPLPIAKGFPVQASRIPFQPSQVLNKSQKDVTSVVPSFACGSTIRCNTPYL